MAKYRNYSLALPLALALSTLCFVSATIYTQTKLVGIEGSASVIRDVFAPGLTYLAKVRRPASEIKLLLVDIERAPKPNDLKILLLPLGRIQRQTKAYLDLPLAPEEQRRWHELSSLVETLSANIESSTEQEGSKRGAILAMTRILLDDIDIALPTTASRMAASLQRHAQSIDQTYANFTRVVVLLNSLSLLLTVGAAATIYRILRTKEVSQYDRQQSLKDRVAQLDAFAGTVAHDIKNPLSTISSGVDALACAASPEEAEKIVTIVRKATSRGLKIVDDLLLFARAQQEPERGQRANVQRVLQDLTAEYKPIAEKKAINLSVDCAQPAEVGCGSGILTSIVENLLRNAVKYMGESTVRHIQVKESVTESCVRIEVSDSGPGISDTVKNHIFEPFFRGPGSVDTGIGLGLATAKRLVEAYGGKIGVQTRLGVGSTFAVELPKAI
ncbi:MAG: sensor histidine kinase [Oligoflexales bacterium]